MPSIDRSLRPALSARPLLIAGLAAGTLDLIYICSVWAFRDVGPLRILQSVASGWLGPEAARAGGAASATLGLVSHYAIALAMAWTYGLAARYWPGLVRRPIACGLAYGMVLYLTMNFVVVPLSAAGPAPARLDWMQVAHLCAHMFLVGIPCALGATMALRDAPPTRTADAAARP